MSTHAHATGAAEPAADTLDRDWLSQWVQPQHLTDEALRQHRADYAADPIPVVRVPDFLDAGVADRLYTFLASEADFEPAFGVYAKKEKVSEAEWTAAADEERLYRYAQLKGARSDVASLNPLLFIKLNKALADRRFLDLFEQLTGTALGPLQSFGGKAFGAEDFLRPHDDRGLDRRLAFIVYLCPGWRADYGGALHVRSRGGEEVVLDIEHNSLVVFDVDGHEAHWIDRVDPAAGDRRRMTLGGWIKSPDGA